jgi:hypothetical protein
MLFTGDNYYPCGGVADFAGRAATLVDTMEMLRRRRHWDWFNIYDTVADITYDHDVFYGLTSNEQRHNWAADRDEELIREDMIRVMNSTL